MVIDGEGWHRGVIGITATRVVERYGRPALVVSREGDEAHGSGRSIPAFHLLNALESCAPLFSRFGGHAHAVGFSLPSSRIQELQAHMDRYARSCLTLADFEPVVNIDAELPLDAVTPDLFEALRRLEPFGAGNPEPVFLASAARVSAPPKILKDIHAKLRFTPGLAAGNGWRRALTHGAMAWRMAQRVNEDKILAGDSLDLTFTIDRNEHPDFGGIELSLRDYRVIARAGAAGRAGA